MGRVFVRSGRLDYRRWLTALKAGRTFVTNGPLLQFSLAGREPGDEIRLPSGTQRLTARISLRSIVPIDSLEIVNNGTVVRSFPLSADRTRADTTVSLELDRSGWYTLRGYSRRSRHPVLDLYPFATTSPIYVVVGEQPIRSAGDARYFMQWLDQLGQAARAHPGWNSDRERDQVLSDIAKARAFFEARSR